jgi:hypothetical protein
VSDELKAGDQVDHLSLGAGIVVQVWLAKAVVQLVEKGGSVTVPVRTLTRRLVAALPELESLTV